MDKHQEALDVLHGFANGNLIRETTCDYQRDKNDEYKDILQELVDKATPKKPLGLSLTHDGRVGNCPFCKKLVRERSKNICECGQKLDWSGKDD